MGKLTKFNSQVPEAVQELFAQIDHGQKQVACTAALIWYFNADEDTQRLYREWARALVEGYATIDRPPESVAAVLSKGAKPRRGKKKQ
ncbi:MAG: hypothetical protein PVJ57_22910 [Phycisphaerae bacterium]|jgi:hypothetical protein